MEQRPTAKGKHTESDALPPVMFSPLSSAVPPDSILKTRLPPIPSSTTPPATSASMVTARLMQSAEPEHMSLLSSYVPSDSTILSTVLSPMAAVSSSAVLAETCVKRRSWPTDSKVLATSRPASIFDSGGGAVGGCLSWVAITNGSVFIRPLAALKLCPNPGASHPAFQPASAAPTICNVQTA